MVNVPSSTDALRQETPHALMCVTLNVNIVTGFEFV